MTDALRIEIEIALLAIGVALGLYGAVCAWRLPNERRPEHREDDVSTAAKDFDELISDVYTERGDRIRRRMLWSFAFAVTTIMLAFWLSLRA